MLVGVGVGMCWLFAVFLDICVGVCVGFGICCMFWCVVVCVVSWWW